MATKDGAQIGRHAPCAYTQPEGIGYLVGTACIIILIHVLLYIRLGNHGFLFSHLFY